MSQADDYQLDTQIGYILRRVTQRHIALFAQMIPDVTTTQFAVLARLYQHGPLSQNQLGRAVALDAATIKGVVDRLLTGGLVQTEADLTDRRRLTVSLSDAGATLFQRIAADGLRVSNRTLDPLSRTEGAQLLALLTRLI